MNTVQKPRPQPNFISRPYWEGAAVGRLMLQQCDRCGQVRHYPRLMCGACHSMEVRWIEGSGRGRIYSWTVLHHAFHPGFAHELPITLVTVQLEEGVRAVGKWQGGNLSIDAPVTASFDQVEGTSELHFQPAPA